MCVITWYMYLGSVRSPLPLSPLLLPGRASEQHWHDVIGPRRIAHIDARALGWVHSHTVKRATRARVPKLWMLRRAERRAKRAILDPNMETYFRALPPLQ